MLLGNSAYHDALNTYTAFYLKRERVICVTPIDTTYRCVELHAVRQVVAWLPALNTHLVTVERRHRHRKLW